MRQGRVTEWNEGDLLLFIIIINITAKYIAHRLTQIRWKQTQQMKGQLKNKNKWETPLVTTVFIKVAQINDHLFLNNSKIESKITWMRREWNET